MWKYCRGSGTDPGGSSSPLYSLLRCVSLLILESVLLCSMSTSLNCLVSPAQALASVDQDRLVQPLARLEHRDSATFWLQLAASALVREVRSPLLLLSLCMHWQCLTLIPGKSREPSSARGAAIALGPSTTVSSKQFSSKPAKSSCTPYSTVNSSPWE